MFRKLLNNKEADARIVGVIVSVLVVISIGLVVYQSISNSVDISSYAGTDAQNQTNETAMTVFTLAPIVAIVLIASIILSAVIGFGTKPGGGL